MEMQEMAIAQMDGPAAVEDTRSVVRLFTLIRYLQYNKTDLKNSIMETVEAGLDLFDG